MKQVLPKTTVTIPEETSEGKKIPEAVGLDGITRRPGDRVVMPPFILDDFLRGIRKMRR